MIIFLGWWLVLSPVSFPINDESKYIYSSDGKWKLVISPIKITTPISLVQRIFNKKYIVLFDKNGKYVGQNSPFCTMVIREYEEFYVGFPSEHDKYLYFQPEECDYTIPINKKEWWSKIIEFIFY
ncbi:hypothetical protein C1141_15825 [Vibrio agarivorans]|nr:hypothetical protein C1141_15825 [Vibrio agarivorans]